LISITKVKKYRKKLFTLFTIILFVISFCFIVYTNNSSTFYLPASYEDKQFSIPNSKNSDYSWTGYAVGTCLYEYCYDNSSITKFYRNGTTVSESLMYSPFGKFIKVGNEYYFKNYTWFFKKNDSGYFPLFQIPLGQFRQMCYYKGAIYISQSPACIAPADLHIYKYNLTTGEYSNFTTVTETAQTTFGSVGTYVTYDEFNDLLILATGRPYNGYTLYKYDGNNLIPFNFTNATTAVEVWDANTLIVAQPEYPNSGSKTICFSSFNVVTNSSPAEWVTTGTDLCLCNLYIDREHDPSNKMYAYSALGGRCVANIEFNSSGLYVENEVTFAYTTRGFSFVYWNGKYYYGFGGNIHIKPYGGSWYTGVPDEIKILQTEEYNSTIFNVVTDNSYLYENYVNGFTVNIYSDAYNNISLIYNHTYSNETYFYSVVRNFSVDSCFDEISFDDYIFENTNVTLQFGIYDKCFDLLQTTSYTYDIREVPNITGSIDVDSLFYRVDNVTFNSTINNNVGDTVNVTSYITVYNSSGSVIFSNNTDLLLSGYSSKTIEFNIGQLSTDAYLIVLQANCSGGDIITLDSEQFVVSNTKVYASLNYQVIVQAGMGQSISIKFTNLLNLTTNETFFVTITGPNYYNNMTFTHEFQPYSEYTIGISGPSHMDGRYNIIVERETNSTETLATASYIVTGQLVYVWKNGLMLPYMFGQLINSLPILIIGILISLFIYFTPLDMTTKIKLILIIMAITLTLIFVPTFVMLINYSQILYFAPVTEMFVYEFTHWLITPWWQQLLGL